MNTEPTGGGQPPQRPTIGDGRYELVSLLGRGGMAEVYRATDLRLGRTVAVKRLRANLAGDQTFQVRFRREAQSAASLNHPAIVAVYDTGEEPDPGGTGLMVPYIVMELVHGRTLRDISREGRKILPERALEIVATVLAALDYSHRAGIIHRDIKPANVMLTPAGDVKVMDFGIARAMADASATMTQTAAVVGTAQYLSPEQARGEQVDARSDLYSTGCLLYELLTGRPPFVGESALSVAYQHVREQPAPPSAYDAEIPGEIDAITMKALAKSTEERYQSAAEMRADISRALQGQTVHAPVVSGPPTDETENILPTESTAPPTTVTPAVRTDEESDDEGSGRKAALWVAIIALVVAVIIAALVVGPRLLSSDAPAQVEVPRVVGVSLEQAKSELQAHHLSAGSVDHENSKTVKEGTVLRQGTPPGRMVDENSTVDLVVSSGTKTAVVPDVTTLSLAAATAKLEGLGFDVTPKKDEKSTEEEDQVTRTDPAAGETLPVGTDITVYYSTGYIEVPSVVGEKRKAAVHHLKEQGFNVVPSMQESDAPKNTVIRQDPVSGTKRPYGSYVTIYLSLGPEPTPTTPTITEPTTTAPTTTAPTTTAPTTTAPTTPTTTEPSTTEATTQATATKATNGN